MDAVTQTEYTIQSVGLNIGFSYLDWILDSVTRTEYRIQ